MTPIVALGAGRMGRGIAQVFAYAGHEVTILDFKQRSASESDDLLAAAKQEVGENLAFLISLGVCDDAASAATLDRIQLASVADAPALLGQASHVFEGVPETLDAKEDALRRVSALVPDDAVIASTSSTMLPDELAGFTARPENFLNAHFLNPAYLIPLVEVSPGDKTNSVVLDGFNNFLESIGKVPVVCRNSPGYIVSRLQALAMNECARMIEDGVATAEDIDKAVRVGFGVRYSTMGFVEFIDWGGLDILYHASRHLAGALGDRFSSPDIVGEYMEVGKLGLKSGQGFYDFGVIDADQYRREKLATFVALLRHLDLMPKGADAADG